MLPSVNHLRSEATVHQIYAACQYVCQATKFKIQSGYKRLPDFSALAQAALLYLSVSISVSIFRALILVAYGFANYLERDDRR